MIRDPLIVMENVAVGDRKEVIDTLTGFGGERKSDMEERTNVAGLTKAWCAVQSCTRRFPFSANEIYA